MIQPLTPLIRSFEEGEPYTQDEADGASFRWLLKKDEVTGLQMGLVELKGPIHKKPASHGQWEQVYLIFSGSGTIHLGRDSRHVSGCAIVVIPRNTTHSVELQAGEMMQYVYVNQYN